MSFNLIKVLLSKKNGKIFLYYKIKEFENIEINDLVLVSIRNRKIIAIVKEINCKKDFGFKIKEVEKIIKISEKYKYFLKNVSDHYLVKVDLLFEKLILLFKKINKVKESKNDTEKKLQKNKNVELNEEQKNSINYFYQFIKKDEFSCNLLKGVTGSGKTFVYFKLIESIINEKNKSVILLAPNIILAENLKKICEDFFEDIDFFIIHSNVSEKERLNVLDAILNKKACLFIGVQIPIFLPIENLGLVVIDEEHNSGYVEQNYPYLNIKETSFIRAKSENIPMFLASATPSVQIMFNAINKKINFFELKNKIFGNLPAKIKEVIFQKDEKNNLLTLELKNLIYKKISKNEQVLLLLNKKGLFKYLKCKSCNSCVQCKNCSSFMTVYKSNLLKCNYCFFQIDFPEKCVNCNLNKSFFEPRGIAIQEAEKIIKNTFPEAVVERIDLDSVCNKYEWQEIIEKIDNNKVDIIIGTSIISQGHNFNNVSLVGVLFSDNDLLFPGYNNFEYFFQNILQVAGRAGRGNIPGEIILQTSRTNSMFNNISENDYDDFVLKELEKRKQFFYPPFSKMAMFKFVSKDKNEVEIESRDFYEKIKNFKNEKLLISEPFSTFLEKIKNNYKKIIIIRAENYDIIKNIFNSTNDILNEKIKIEYIPFPQQNSYF